MKKINEENNTAFWAILKDIFIERKIKRLPRGLYFKLSLINYAIILFASYFAYQVANADWSILAIPLIVLLIVIIIFSLIVGFWLQVLRFHDIGESAFPLFFSFIGLISYTIFCVLLFELGDKGANKYGEPFDFGYYYPEKYK